MFVHDQQPDPTWQADLETLVPRHDRLNWLAIVWEPGMPYEPVQRWEIREMVPRMPAELAEIVEDLRGPSPRERGRWVEDDTVPQHLGGKRWHSDSLVSLTQWRVFQQTGCYSQRYWIIQGPFGGHPLRYTEAEQNFRASKGLPDAPPPGDMDYAPYTHRVGLKASACDKLRRWKSGLAFDQRAERKTAAGLWVRRDRWNEEQEFAARMLTWMEDEISAVVSDMPRRLAAELVGAAPVAPDGTLTEDPERLDQELLTRTGSAF